MFMFIYALVTGRAILVTDHCTIFPRFRYPTGYSAYTLSLVFSQTYCRACCRNQAKLQQNLMYLAAIADSQPPQTASLSQVLIVAILILLEYLSLP
jgi:hypothetical protein